MSRYPGGMRRLVWPLALVASGTLACSDAKPPTLGDPDAAAPRYDASFLADAAPVRVDAGGDGGQDAVQVLDFQGGCISGEVPVWQFFDFQTHTPGDSGLRMVAATAATQAGLDAAPTVALAHVTGPDITVWTGVDVGSRLATIGQPSKLFLRVTVTFERASDGTAPVLTASRQLYDCVPGY